MNKSSDMNEANAIVAQGVTKVFGQGPTKVVALDDVAVEIRQNEFFTLLGPSGCGKTTLLRLIAGFDHPTAGQLLLNGLDITNLPPFERPVNTVFQNYALFPHMTVAENIGFGLQMQGRPKNEVASIVEEMLQLVQMKELSGRRTDQISGGQQQRVALARALAPRPEVLLLDEPLSALDYKLRKEMQIELKRLQHETGITFIFVTHDQEEALTMSDRIAVMSNGHILQIGSPREIYDHPAERFVANFIGDTNFLNAELVSSKGSHGVVRLASGIEIKAAVPSSLVSSGAVTLAIRPEHTLLSSAAKNADLEGILEEIVYRGIDTHYHVKLADGGIFVTRLQNLRDKKATLVPGQKVGIKFAPEAVQVLRD